MAPQAIIYAAHVIPLVVLWLATVLEWLPILSYGPDCDCFRHFIHFAPLYALIGLGIYALFSVIYGVATFNDCADARKELIEEIQMARADLKGEVLILQLFTVSSLARVPVTWQFHQIKNLKEKKKNLSGFINALFLCVIAVFILIEALERIFDPLNVNTDKLLDFLSIFSECIHFTEEMMMDTDIRMEGCILPHIDGPAFFPFVPTITPGSYGLLDLYNPRTEDALQQYLGSTLLEPRSLYLMADDAYISADYIRLAVPLTADVSTDGGAPRLPWKHPKIIALRDTHSIYQLKCLLKDAKTVVIVGNGGIATELVYELQDMAIHWVIRDAYPSSVFFLPQVSKFLEHRILEKELQPLSTELFKRDRFTTGVNQSHFEVAGCALGPDWNSTINLSGSSNNRKVTFHCLEEVVDVTSDQSAHLKLTLSNQTSICCDFAIWATGVTPLSGVWKENCSDLKLAQDGGITVDEQMRTSVHDVFACGDVCTVFWPHIENTWKQMRLWTQARQMGSYCAFSMLSNFPTELDFCFEIFAHVTSFCGMKVVFLGDFKGENQPSGWYVRERIIGHTEYVCCVLVNHRVVGATLIGNTQLEETIENLILNKTDLSQIEEHFLDPSIDIEDYFD